MLPGFPERSDGEGDQTHAALFGDGEVAFPGMVLGEDGAGEPDKVVGRPEVRSENDHSGARLVAEPEGEFAEILVEGQDDAIVGEGQGQDPVIG